MFDKLLTDLKWSQTLCERAARDMSDKGFLSEASQADTLAYRLGEHVHELERCIGIVEREGLFDGEADTAKQGEPGGKGRRSGSGPAGSGDGQAP